MEDRLLDKIAEPFNINLPEYKTMAGMIDAILPAVQKFGEPTIEAEEEDSILFRTSWVFMDDKPGATAVVLWKFSPGGEIKVATDGKMTAQSWNPDETNPRRIIIGDSMFRDSFLYDLGFMDGDFMILRRHGNVANMSAAEKYIFLTREAIGTRLTWDEALERLAAKYRNSQFPLVGVALFIAALIALMLYLR